MNKTAICHSVDSDYCYPLSDTRLLIRLRAARDDLQTVTLLHVDKYHYLFGQRPPLQQTPLQKQLSDELFDYYEIELRFEGLSLGYAFELDDGQTRLYSGNDSFFGQRHPPAEICYMPAFFTMPVLDPCDVFTPPGWARQAVVYQIMPDRFHRDRASPPEKTLAPWHCTPQLDTRLGGTLLGIVEKLPYLSELGINTLYLTPIFQADGYHKYCTTDYRQVDPQLGTAADLHLLVHSAHNLGIRIILDAVFSCSGIHFFAFADLLARQQASPYADWYKVLRFPVTVSTPANYKCFGHFPILPKFNFGAPALWDYLLETLVYWIREFDIDGWRLDVADEVPHAFWRQARQVVKAAKADALLVGEIWYDSRPWLRGDQLDTVMNYRFYTSLLDFLVYRTLDAIAFGRHISHYLADYRQPTHPLLWNLLGSHDTVRLAQLLALDKLRLAAVILLTLVGTPMLYYGDELGLPGGADPDNRRGMPWDTAPSSDLLPHYRRLIQLRHRQPALSGSQIRFLADSPSLLHYQRGQGRQRLDILINNHAEPTTWQPPQGMMDLYEAQALDGPIPVAGWGFRILQARQS